MTLPRSMPCVFVNAQTCAATDCFEIKALNLCHMMFHSLFCLEQSLSAGLNLAGISNVSCSYFTRGREQNCEWWAKCGLCYFEYQYVVVSFSMLKWLLSRQGQKSDWLQDPWILASCCQQWIAGFLQGTRKLGMKATAIPSFSSPHRQAFLGILPLNMKVYGQ